MSTLSSPTSALPYARFRSDSPDWNSMDHFGEIVLEDGSKLYEDEWSGLFHSIIWHDDVAMLNRYLAANVRSKPLAYYPEDHDNDPFHSAAESGSTNVLRTLLELWEASHSSKYAKFPPPDKRRFCLLTTACGVAAVDTFRLLLSEPWKARYGNI